MAGNDYASSRALTAEQAAAGPTSPPPGFGPEAATDAPLLGFYLEKELEEHDWGLLTDAQLEPTPKQWTDHPAHRPGTPEAQLTSSATSTPDTAVHAVENSEASTRASEPAEDWRLSLIHI